MSLESKAVKVAENKGNLGEGKNTEGYPKSAYRLPLSQYLILNYICFRARLWEIQQQHQQKPNKSAN